MSRPYQIIIFGASGFTGEYVVEHLAKFLNRSRSSLSWATAGRSETKVKETLASVRSRVSTKFEDIPVITSDVTNDSSLDSMTKQADLLINCTGPYRFYGETVVASCVRNSCHYIDISGEPQFMENMQLKYHEAAVDKGVYVIPGCGFDSIPCDLGVNFVKDAFKPGRLDFVESFLYSTASTANHTTWECAVEGLADVRTLKSIRKQLYRQNYEEVNKMRSKFPLKRREIGRFSDQATGLNGWIVPFIGADRSVVRRSQMENYIFHGEKDVVQMEAYVIVNYYNFLRILLAGLWLKLLSPVPSGRSLLKKFPGFFTNGLFTKRGPSREETDTATFSYVFLGKGWKEGEDQDQPPESRIAARVSGPHLGYPTCAICVCQAALTLLQETNRLPSKGGVFTPGTAFRKTSLIRRLNEDGVVFTLL